MGAVPAAEIDPVYGHKTGEAKCVVTKCQGHQEAWKATSHRLYEEFYTSTRRENRLKKQEKAEAKIVESKGQRRVKGLAPRNTTVKPEKKEESPLTEAYKVLLPKTYHYHKGRRGRCSCSNPHEVQIP